jgi:hypothetical protein
MWRENIPFSDINHINISYPLIGIVYYIVLTQLAIE